MLHSSTVEQFFDAIGTVAQSKVDKINKDVTIDAEIFSILNVENGEYRVKYQGNTFNAYCFDPTIVFNLGDRVYVLVPQGDFSNKKMILGHSEYNNTGYQDSVVSKNFYVDRGANWLDDYPLWEPMKICACPEENESLLKDEANYIDYGYVEGRVPNETVAKYPHRNYPSLSDASAVSNMRESDQDIERQAANYKYIKIQADFRTEFVGPHEEGEYSLQVTCLQKNPQYTGSYELLSDAAFDWLNYPEYLDRLLEGNISISQSQVEGSGDVLPYIPITFELSFGNFSGSSPYAFSSLTTQKAYFNIEDLGLAGLYSIALVQNGKFKSDVQYVYKADGTGGYDESTANYNKNNIFCENVQIYFCEQVNLYNTLYYPWISLPYGDALYGTSPTGRERNTVELVAHFQYKQLDLTENTNCRVIWFRQKADVIASSYKDKDKDEFGHSWFEYGGSGWYPIQKIIDETPLDEKKKKYEINGNTLTIYKEAVPHSFFYKAVMVYYEPQTSGDSTYYKEISRGQVTQKIVRKDSIYDLEIEDFEYDGVRYLRIKDNNSEVDYKVYLDAKAALQAAKDELAIAEYEGNETRKNNAQIEVSAAQLRLQRVINNEWCGTWFVKLQDNSYNQISEKQLRGPIDIDRFCQDSCEFYVMAYDPAEIGWGYADPTETAVLEYLILPPERSQMVVDWQGQSDFNYDALGGLRNDVSMTEYVLTPVLRFAKGAGSHYGMKVIAPDGITELGSVMYSDQIGASGFNLSSSMMKDMYIDSNYGIHFHIKPTYNPAATDNTFTLIVTLINGDSFPVEKTVSFSKDGDQGTIGNEWKAQILPTNWKADSKELLFTSQYVNTPIPLVLEPTSAVVTDPLAESYTQNEKYRLFLRPFVTRNGIPLEQIDKQEAYFYKCSWDVRLPSAASIERTQRSSFLRLRHASRYDPTTDTPIQGAYFDCTSTSPWEMDGMKVGNGDSDIKVNSNETEPRGLVGFTIYPSSPYYSKDKWFQNTDNECYGAVEVCYYDNLKGGTHTTLEMNQYHFIVKCQIDVFQGGYDLFTKQIRTEGHIKRVASIISYYPVDLFFNDGKVDVDTGDFASFPKRIATNWPRFVYYSASGDYPETMTDSLYFKFGGFLQNEPVNYKPKNLSGQTQSIQEQARYKDGVIDHYDWLYQPNPHLDPIAGYHGALCTDRENGPFKGGWYLRNQIMISNLYGNVDINAWDGQGLDTNDKDGTIFGSVFGAGYKNPVNNQFTGVLMGADKAQPRKDIQGNRTGYNSEEDEYRPYLTGLFGYQDGHQSFGLMENGTAFFGRADRGGRIIIDGSNALIYGGANGIINSPSIADPMWNTMRLNLIDLTHATTDSKKDADSWYTNRQPTDGDPNTDLGGKSISPTYIGVKNGDNPDMVLGFNGEFFTYSDGFDIKTLPKWYKTLWSNGYIKPDNSIPYWLEDYPDSSAPGGVRKKQAGPWHDGTGFVDGEGEVGIWDGVMPEPGSANLRVNYFEKQWIGLPDPTKPSSPIKYYNWDQIENNSTLKALYQEKVVSGEIFTRSSFGPNRASTTPAIEIGQHLHGLMPGLIPYDQYEEVFKTLAIPGDRNFMVTYDGTLWAMNGVFMGAVIGSNIIGGRIQGAELAMGDSQSVSKTKEIRTLWGKNARYFCDWSSLMPPRDAVTPLSDMSIFDSGRAFNVNSDGYIGANSLVLTGGSIDIGGFHLIGKETLEFLHVDIGKNKDEIGHLIQNGKSDFIGLTHFYGNVGIAPALDSSVSQSNTGAFTQTGGVTILGGILDGNNTVNHEYIDDFAFKRAKQYYAGTTSSIVNGIGKGGSLEQSAIFAINTRGQLKSSTGIQSHLWPLHFKAFTQNNKVQSYVTVMNQFKNWEKISPPKPAFPFNVSGSNYFRIGQWGAEVMTMFIRSSFQLEEQSKIPTYDTNNIEDQCRGYFGSVNRAGYGDSAPTLNGAIGLTSWSRNAILCNSDDSIGLKARTVNVLQGGYRGTKYNDSSSATVTEEEDFQPMKSYTATLFAGSSTESSGPPNGQIIANTTGGYVSLGTYRNTDFGNIIFNGNYMSQSTALYMKSDNESGIGDKNSVYMFATGEEDENSRSGVHIFCRPASDTFQGCFWALTPELFLSPQYAILSGKKGVGIQAFNNGNGNEAHKMGDKGLYITEDGTKLQVKGFEPEFQEGIYARFA